MADFPQVQEAFIVTRSVTQMGNKGIGKLFRKFRSVEKNLLTILLILLKTAKYLMLNH